MRSSRCSCLQNLVHSFWTVFVLICVSSALVLTSGCTQDVETESLTVAGSTTVLPIAEIAAERFKEHYDIPVLVSGLGSSAGIEAAMNKTADIATSSRSLTAEEEATNVLKAFVVAHDGIAVIINPENPVNDISLEQLRDIYSGKIHNWSELGGPDLAIQLVNRDEASGTREAFRSIVMKGSSFDLTAAVLPGTGQVRDVVSRTPGAIGYISIGFVQSDYAKTTVKSLSINGVLASEENVSTGKYPISRDLYFFTNGEPSPLAKRYIDFVLSDEMKQTIREAGYIPVETEQGGAKR